MRKAGLDPEIHCVETSPVLRAEQARRLGNARFHADVTSLPEDQPLLVIANEFFDALPIHQLVKSADGWRERRIACQDTLFLPVAGKRVPLEIIAEDLRDAPPGSILESSPASVAVMRAVAKRVAAQGGGALIIDYGYDGLSLGETLQAVKRHGPANPFEAPGEQDLTAHVDFATLASIALLAGARVHGPVSQSAFLGSLGIAERATALARANPAQGAALAEAHHRLASPAGMGSLFRAMALTAPGWPEPAGMA
jgi:SAM-dependent MidA family methyltransferase